MSRRLAIVRAAAVLPWLAACAAAGPVTSGETDGASWIVAIERATWPAGEGTLGLAVTTADGAPGEALDVLLITGMGDMTHAPDTEWCEEEAPGAYTCPVRFTMPGLWSVEGTVSDGGDAEAFHLAVAVE
jgi:hypothetical protein